MALASCAWIQREISGKIPSPRQGHAIAQKGSTIYLFGGSDSSKKKRHTVFFNDMYTMTVNGEEIEWAVVNQKGAIPAARDGHSLCAIGKKLFLYGGRGEVDASTCISKLYVFDIESCIWEELETSGCAPETLNHSMTAVEGNLYVFGGVQGGEVSNTVTMLNLDNMIWVQLPTSGHPPPPRCDHAALAFGDKIFISSGCGGEGLYYNDIHILDTATLRWDEPDVEGDIPVPRSLHTLIAHGHKDLYMFGGCNDSLYDACFTLNDVHKLSLAKMKWKRPLYTGCPAERRCAHTAFIHQHKLYVIGGMGEGQELNDVKVLKLINPSERKPILTEMKVETQEDAAADNDLQIEDLCLSYTLKNSPFSQPTVSALATPAVLSKQVLKELEDIEAQAQVSIKNAIEMLQSKFLELEKEKAELAVSRDSLAKEREAYRDLYHRQQQELQQMLEEHQRATDSWLQTQRQQIEQESREVSATKLNLLVEQERLFKQQSSVNEKSKKMQILLSQLKGI